MQAILGIDAAWTEREPTGVALVHGEGSSWSVVCVAPSYEAFVACSQGVPINWQAAKFRGAWPNIAKVIKAARELTAAELSVVAIDMPVATAPFDSRRSADTAISKAFGGQGCSAHSPNAIRPGPLGASLMAQLTAEGFPLATRLRAPTGPPCTIEVYPHPALLALMSRKYRVPYKVSRSAKYWKGTSVADRISKLLNEFMQINAALGSEFGHEPIDLPATQDVRTLAALKRHEDALDALVCAWVGLRFLQGAAVAHGDDFATVWVPEHDAASAQAVGRPE